MAFRAKFTIFFNAKSSGFSETWYTSDASYDATMQRAIKYLNKRKELLGKGVACVGIRVSDDTVQRDSIVYIPAGKEATSSLFGSNDDDVADKTGMSALIRVEATPFHRRLWALRGAPDRLFVASNDNGLDIGMGWLTPFNALKTYMLAGSFNIRVPTGVPAPNNYQLIQITDLFPERAAYRKPGRPFGQVPGRRIA